MKKSALFAIVGVVAVAAIGMTFALSKDRAILGNSFALLNYQTTVTDEFVSPKNWTTCQTVPKEITVTNYSDKAVAVRIKLEEDWIAANGTTHLPLVSAASNLTMAQIEFTPNSGWTAVGEYYVYDTDLAPNVTTSSLITGVTLNCSANLDTSDGAAPDSDGAYAGGEYHLKATIQTIEADKKRKWMNYLYDAVASQVNDPYDIDFTKKAMKSNDLATANGNGVNRYTEKGQDVYYFRGEVDNNNVVWADKCWLIVRTTYSGGVKMIYNGSSADVDGAKQCPGDDAQIVYDYDYEGQDSFKFGGNYGGSPADVGYMYGERIVYHSVQAGTTTFTFSNDVSRSGDTYILDTSAGQSITGTWADERKNAAERYHYFCTNGATSCDSTEIGYILVFYKAYDLGRIYYLPVDGYDDIEEMKAAMFENYYDSRAKSIIESWFEAEGLDAREDDLEDAIFCNDRSYVGGSLKGKDSNATGEGDNYHGAYIRNRAKNAQNNLDPSLDCASKNDSFTKYDTTNGNGMLYEKTGLITADEVTLGGAGFYVYDFNNYLASINANIWTMSPQHFDSDTAYLFCFSYGMGSCEDYFDGGLRPLVSLKEGTIYASGTGLKTDPYIIP